MKIVNLTQFLALPEGTLFQEFDETGQDTALKKKLENCNSNDFFFLTLTGLIIEHGGSEDFHNKQQRMMKNDTSIPIQFCEERDGSFDPSMLFIVWEPSDVAALIEELK